MEMRDAVRQTIQTILTLVGVLVAIAAYIGTRRRKELRYRILSATPLLSSGEQVGHKVQVLFDGKPVEGVQVIVMEIVNSGNVPIRPADFERPLSFSFGDRAHVLLAEVVSTDPIALKPELQSNRGSIKIAPVLMNGDDWVRIKVLVARYGNCITPDSRVEGVRDVLPFRESRRLLWVVVLITVAISLTGWLLSSWYAPPPSSGGQFVPVPGMRWRLPVYLSVLLLAAVYSIWTNLRKRRKK
jgi:hypothetical protein